MQNDYICISIKMHSISKRPVEPKLENRKLTSCVCGDEVSNPTNFFWRSRSKPGCYQCTGYNRDAYLSSAT